MAVDVHLVVSHYRSGLTLRECAKLFGISMQRVHQIVSKIDPDAMRAPYVVPPRRRGKAARK